MKNMCRRNRCRRLLPSFRGCVYGIGQETFGAGCSTFIVYNIASPRDRENLALLFASTHPRHPRSSPWRLRFLKCSSRTSYLPYPCVPLGYVFWPPGKGGGGRSSINPRSADFTDFRKFEGLAVHLVLFFLSFSATWKLLPEVGEAFGGTKSE